MRLPMLLEQKQKCPLCKSEVNRDPLSFRENPFCDSCTAAALALKREERVSLKTARSDGYWEAKVSRTSC